jgi:hypothetical protein
LEHLDLIKKMRYSIEYRYKIAVTIDDFQKMQN